MILSQIASALGPWTMPVVVIAPGFTSAFISWPLLASMASIELNGMPVASTPTLL